MTKGPGHAVGDGGTFVVSAPSRVVVMVSTTPVRAAMAAITASTNDIYPH